MGLATVAVFKKISGKNSKLKQMSDEQLKRLQKVLLGMMGDFDKVCKEHKINYMLGGGSCLGAVRHGGFIPWDDDMDLNMSRRDYEKLRKVFKDELGEKYWLQTPEDTHNYGLGFARLRKKGTIFRSREDVDSSEELGIYIDIFIIENTYNYVLMRYLHGFLSLLTGFLLSCRNFFKNREFYMELAGNDKKTRIIFRTKIIIGFLMAFLSVDSWVRIWNNVNKMCKDCRSKYVTVPVGRKHFFGDMYLRKGYLEYQRIKFENMELPVPVDVDGYMKKLYGDYMKMPEKEDQETHVFLELDFGDVQKT